MNESNHGMEFEIRRHPERSGAPVTTQNPEGEDGLPGPLPKEGIQQAQAEAREFAEHIKDIPRAVVFGFTGNQPRTVETDYIFGEELKYMAKQLPGSRVFNLQEEGTIENIAIQIEDQDDKVIITGSPLHSGLGMKNWNVEYYARKVKELGGELPFLRQWMGDPIIQQDAGVTPQQIIDDARNWIREQQATAAELFPGRPVIITGIGHSNELDTIIASLLGKEISEKTMDEMGGGVINTMEGARIVIDGEGKGTVEYRGMSEELDLGPTQE